MATSSINNGFSYSTYKATPKAVTVPKSGTETDITNTVTIPAGVYFARVASSINESVNYWIKDSSGTSIANVSVGGGGFSTIFRITSQKTVKASVNNFSSQDQTQSSDNGWYGLYLCRLGNP